MSKFALQRSILKMSAIFFRLSYNRKFESLRPARKRLALARLFIIAMLMMSMASCRSSKGIVRHHEEPRDVVHFNHVSKHRKAIVDEAYTWIGTPYKYAAQEKGGGTDCSGMVMIVYQDVTGEKLPRNSAKQAEFCDKIASHEVLAGDLVFFATGKDPNKVSHVGIVVDEDNFIHASSSKGVVVSKLSASYYRRTFLMFGRVPGMKK